MRRLFYCLIAIGLLAIAGCSNASNKEADETKEMTFEFTGTIEEINDNQALVETNSDSLKDGLSLENEVMVDLSVNSKQSFQIGEEVRVKAGNEILDSDPPQVDTLSVELMK